MINLNRSIRAPKSGVFVALILLSSTLAAGAQSGEAAIDIPEAGRGTNVAQTSFRDGYAQRITYAGGTRNYAEISVRTGTEMGGRFGSALSLAKPTRLGIAAELATRFPGEAMRVSTIPKRNAYGPVGIALGSNCLYAWQWIDLAPRLGGRTDPGSLFGASTERAASLRVSLCRTASATLADLVAGVERMRISVGAGGGEGRSRQSISPPARARRERPSAPIAKEAAKPAQAPGAMERPSARDRRSPPEPVADRSVPTLPPPPATGITVPLPAGQPGTPRYITDPIPNAAPAAPVAVPKPAQRNPETDERLSQDLPLRAYRPPP
ncbi:cellulose biosynthesis protein BcsN [Methylobacterium sp. 77]|uniref:cellulose biosynthesis protein BcsN n=1 Tax=Methylobacterium sp. 77 TaxID=1101192 RepID=UPI00036CD183|nr:cellulose biosynthesis protein BcsN [Methylobacterium sp. 77]